MEIVIGDLAINLCSLSLCYHISYKVRAEIVALRIVDRRDILLQKNGDWGLVQTRLSTHIIATQDNCHSEVSLLTL